MKYSNVKTAINLEDSFLVIYQKIKSQTPPQKNEELKKAASSLMWLQERSHCNHKASKLVSRVTGSEKSDNSRLPLLILIQRLPVFLLPWPILRRAVFFMIQYINVQREPEYHELMLTPEGTHSITSFTN